MHSNRLFVMAIAVAALILVWPDPSRRTSAASQAGVRERVLYTSVVDKNGEPVMDLKADEFVVREDNARREILRVSRASDPMALAVLVDNSTAAERDVQNIRTALTSFIKEMRGEHDIAIVGLGDRPTILQDYTRNGELLNAAANRVFAQPGSGMMFLEAIIDVSKGLAKRDESRANIVAIITDGTEFSTQHYNQVLDALKAGGAALHALTIGTFGLALSDELRNRAVVLDAGPRRSGGQRVPLLSGMGLEGALQRLARELKNQYKVVFSRPESLIQPDAVTVTVTRPGLTARGTPERRKPGA